MWRKTCILTVVCLAIAGPPGRGGAGAALPPAPQGTAPRPAVDADCPPDAPGALVRRLLGWLAAHSDYDTGRAAADPPEIRFCRSGEVIRYEGHDILVEPDLRAAFDLRARRIYLVLPWRADDPRNVSALLHELIHDVQFAARDWPCPQATEWEAYRLQAAWLEEQGIDPGFDWFGIHMRARCPGDVHP
jgi:hypothetical protein